MKAYLIPIIAGVVGFLWGYLVSQLIKGKIVAEANSQKRENKILSEKNRELELELKRTEEWRDLIVRLKEENAGLTARIDAERIAGAEKLALLQMAREELSGQFKNLAQEIFDEKTKTFKETNTRELAALLNPFNEKITDFKKQVSETYQKEAMERSALKREIEMLASLNKQISTDTENLTNALQGKSKTQGVWGEMILERVLEQSGLRKGSEYEVQVGKKSDENQQCFLDAVVHIPGNREVIIDSKVSLTAYNDYVASGDELSRQQALKNLVSSVRTHVKELAKKDYSSLPDINTVDFVLMFVPIEGAFSAAVLSDNKLFNEAFASRIVIVSPSTLFATLRTIENNWRYEKQAQNAQIIAEKAGRLYDKFVGFTDDLLKVGEQLERTRNLFDGAMGKLKGGQGNLVRRAEELKKLGAQTGKQISEKLTDGSDET